jgi:hypothetical protein
MAAAPEVEDMAASPEVEDMAAAPEVEGMAAAPEVEDMAALLEVVMVVVALEAEVFHENFNFAIIFEISPFLKDMGVEVVVAAGMEVVVVVAKKLPSREAISLSLLYNS